ncbi:MAG: hypothetical protein QOG83_3387 [Alphaproteobacteria bacterium]|nr:hypothetical protein [Alphaproteobacteria bacterium]
MAVRPVRKVRSSPRRQAILILGMHRCGTSALAGALCALGAAPPRTLMGPSELNLRGFWESVALVEAHDQLLTAASSAWHDWQQLDPRWFQTKDAQRHRKKIKDILVDEFDDKPLFVIKEPRICRFVPFFLSILNEMNVRTAVFMPFRNPLEVASSLKRPYGFDSQKSWLLWMRHVLEAEYHSRGMPRSFINYEDLVRDWRPHLTRALQKLEIEWPVGLDDARPTVEEFLTMDLYRERSSLKKMREHAGLPHDVRETYDILRDFVAAGESESARDRLDLIAKKFNESCDVFGKVAGAEAKRALGASPPPFPPSALADKLHREYTQAIAQRDRLKTLLDQQRLAFEHEQAEAAQARAISSQKDLEHQRLSDDLRAFAAEAERLRADALEQEAERRRLAAALDVSVKEAQTLQAYAIEQEAERRRLAVALDASAKEAQTLQAYALEQEAERRRLAAALDASANEAKKLQAYAIEQEAERRRLAAALRASANEAEKLQAYAIEQEAERRRLAAAIDASANEAEKLRSDVMQQAADRQRLETELSGSAKQTEELQAELSRGEAARQLLASELQVAAKEAEKLRVVALQQEAKFDRMVADLESSAAEMQLSRAALNQYEMINQRLANRVLRFESEISLLRRDLPALRFALDEMRKSRSWRVTKPLRALHLFLLYAVKIFRTSSEQNPRL